MQSYLFYAPETQRGAVTTGLYTHTHTHTHTQIHTHTRTHTHTQMHKHTNIYKVYNYLVCGRLSLIYLKVSYMYKNQVCVRMSCMLQNHQPNTL